MLLHRALLALTATLAFTIIMTLAVSIGLAANTIPKRGEVAAETKWRLADIYASDDLWEEDFAKAKGLIPEVARFKGRLGESGETLLASLQLNEKLSRILDNLYLYANMRRDEDANDPIYQALADRVQALAVEAGSAASFVSPEILAIPEEKLAGFVAETPGLALYEFMLSELNRQRPHTLSASEEELLAQAGEIAGGPYNIFNALRTADLRFPPVTDAVGQEHPVSEGKYVQLLENPDRGFRQASYESLFGTYQKFQNTLSATYSTQVKRDLFFARVRKYDSALGAALFGDNIPVAVYDNVIDTVGQNLAPLHRYVALRRKVLGLDAVHAWDMFVPLVKDVDIAIPYSQSKEMVLAGLAPLGAEYRARLEAGFTSGWIDVYENEGKRSGGYSWGGYDTHPYILLNYSDNFDSMLTVAHELGHAIHSDQSNRSQQYVYANYSIFVAEVASTTNEALMMEYLLDKETDRNKRLYILNKYLENIRGTVYTQTMFAEFEKAAHEMAERGEALTAKNLSALWGDLNKKYFGPEYVVDDVAKVGWGRIPHFYSNFYVYKYVTGLAAGTALAEKIATEGQPAIDRYFTFLRAGGSDQPLNILKAAGVDMSTPAPLEATIRVFERLLGEMERLMQLS